MSSQTLFVTKGTADVSLDIPLQSSVDGSPMTGLVFNSAGLQCYYRRGGTGTLTALPLVTQTVGGAHTDGGFVEISAASAPGMYKINLSDIIASAGEDLAMVVISGAADLQPHTIHIVLQDAIPTTAEILAAITDMVVETEGNITLQQAVSTLLSFGAGVTSSGGTVLKSPNGVATRITATVNASNERTAMTLTPSA